MTKLSGLSRPPEAPVTASASTARFLQTCALALLAAFAPALKAAPANDRVTLPTRTPALATPALSDLGAVPSAAPVTLTIRLAIPAGRVAALKQRLADQVDPASPQYHVWLTPQQFAASFGAPDDQVAAATLWLAAQSLTVSALSASHTTLTVTAPASQIEAAFAVSLRQVTLAGSAYFANATQPSLPEDAATLIAGVSGLDNLPAAITLAGSTSTDIPAVLDANETSVLSLTSTACAADMAQGDLDTYTALFRQANAQGITVIASSTCPAGTGFPADLPEVTAVTLPGLAPALTPVLFEPRPTWQVAPGLPDDQFRHEPDLTASTLAAFSRTIAALAGPGRLGNVNATLYDLAPTPGLFTQADTPTPGTWEPPTGLGLVDLDQLTKVFPRGTGASFTSFAASTYSPVHGSTVTFTSKVTSGTGGAIPTGTVTYTNSAGVTLGSGALSNGTATFSTNTLPGGSNTITATYSGDATYAVSSSSAGLYVTAEDSKLSVAVSSGNVVGGNYTVTVTDTAASGVSRPTGTATVTLSGTTTTYTGALVASGANSSVAIITVPATTVGTSTLSINCSGDANYGCVNPFTTTVTVGKATPTIVLSFTPSPPVSGAAISFTATLAAVGNAAVPTGNVTFSDNGTVIQAGKLASGTVTVTGTDITAANHTITATYDGDPNYLTATASAATSGTSTTATAITPSATKNTGQALSFTATITPATVINNTQPTGTVQFLDGATPLGTVTATAGVATISAVTLSTTVASHSITAVYSGTATYSGSTSPAAIVTTSTATSTALTPSATKNTGQSFSFVAAVTPSAIVSGTQPSGTIQFNDGPTPLGNVPLTAGSATLVVPALSTSATHSVVAVYSGDALYDTSNSPPVTLSPNVGATASTTTLTANPTTVTAGGSVTYTATVAATTTNTTVPTGTVAVTASGTPLCTITLASGTGSCSAAALTTLGSNAITGTYSGDATYATSAGAATVTVASAAVTGTIAATIAPSPAAYNTYAVVTVTFTATSTTTTVPTGATVTASYSGLTGTYTGTVSSTGTATITIPTPPPAIYNVVVSCVTTTNFSCSNTANVPLTTTKSATSTSLSVNPTTVLGTQPFTLTATVVPSPGTTPLTTPISGTVTFFNNGAAIGSASVNSAGVATRTTTLAGGGTGVYTATYTGDANYLTSTTVASTTITATRITPTIVFFSNGSPTLQGLNVTLTVQVTNYTAQAGSVPVPGGQVTFYDTSTGVPLFLGTASLGSNGVATGIAVFSTTGLFAGTHTIYAVYAGDGNYLPVTSSVITIDVSDFRLAFYPSAFSIARGGSGSTTIVATPIDQFNGTITMACTSPIAETTCSISPSVLSTGGQATLTITTTAPGRATPAGPQTSNRPWRWQAGADTTLALLFLFALPIPKARRRKLRAARLLSLALFLTGISATLGCGNTVSTTSTGTTTTGTPLGTAVFTVTAQGQEPIGTNRHSYTLQVTVTP